MAKEEEKPEWIIEVSCPFCGEVVLESTDFSELPYDMSDDEREEIELNEEIVDGCEHLAFSSDWAYAGPDIYDVWKKEMTMLAKAINKQENHKQRITKQNLGKIIDDFRISIREDNFKDFAADILPNYDFAYVNKFICKNDGIDGRGGADYGFIFLCKKDKRKKSQISSKKPLDQEVLDNIKAAEQGNLWAQLELAGRYDLGLGIDKDVNESKKWFSKVLEGSNPADLKFSCDVDWGWGNSGFYIRIKNCSNEDWSYAYKDYKSNLILEFEYDLKHKHNNTIEKYYGLLPVPNIESGKVNSYIRGPGRNLDWYYNYDIVIRKALLYYVRPESSPAWPGKFDWF